MSIPSSHADFLHVVAAVIRDGAGRVLIARRHADAHQGGLWEFSGGKLEGGESPYAALQRELAEELGIAVEAAEPLITIPHRYPDRNVLLEVWSVTAYGGTPQGREGQPLQWAAVDALDGFPFPAANLPIVVAVRLPDSYLITPEPGPQRAWPAFLQRLEAVVAGGVRLVQLRAKGLAEPDLLALARQALSVCHRHGAEMLLNGTPQQAADAGADGLHLSGGGLAACAERPVEAGRWLGVSCHSADDLVRAAAIGADFAVLSPVRPTASHPQAAPIGWSGFADLVQHATLPVYALGGVGEADIAVARQHGGQGIAAIRALWGEDVPNT